MKDPEVIKYEINRLDRTIRDPYMVAFPRAVTDAMAKKEALKWVLEDDYSKHKKG